MDKETIQDFIETAKPNLLKKYAGIVTEMLNEAQIKALEGLFEIKVSLRDEPLKVPEIKQKVAKTASKPEPQREPAQSPRPKQRPQMRPETEIEEPDNEEEIDDDVFNDDGIFAEKPLTQEDIDKISKEQY